MQNVFVVIILSEHDLKKETQFVFSHCYIYFKDYNIAYVMKLTLQPHTHYEGRSKSS